MTGTGANGVTPNNPYYRANTAITPSLGDTVGRNLFSNLVTIGSKFLSNLVNGDPNKIAAEAANPYNSPAYVAQLQAQQQAQQAQVAAASARAAQVAAAARASPVPGSAAYYEAQNGNLYVNGARVTSAPIGSPTLTPDLIREAARKAAIISDYYKNHPSAGIIGTGLYGMQPSATTTATSTSTPVPIDPNTGEYPGSTDPTDSQYTETGGSDTTLQTGSTVSPVANTIAYPGTTYPGTTYPGTTYPSTTDVTDTTLSGTSGTTCQVTALNAGNCNPNFRNKICDLGCTNNEQAAVAALCQKNGCSVGVGLSFFLRLVYSNANGTNPANRPHSQLPRNNRHNRLPQHSRNGQRKRPEVLQRPHTQRSRRSLLQIHSQTSRTQVRRRYHSCSSN